MTTTDRHSVVADCADPFRVAEDPGCGVWGMLKLWRWVRLGRAFQDMRGVEGMDAALLAAGTSLL